MAISKDLVAASATPMVLSILSQGENYGYAIIKRVRELSGGEMNWTDGMLYPVLHRLEQQGLIESRWDVPESGRKRKYYRVTRRGVGALKDHRSQWIVVFSALNKSWEEQSCLI